MSATLAKKKFPQGNGAGMVTRQIRGNATGVELSTGKLIEVINAGLPVSELEDLQASLGVPMDKLSPKLGISIATVQRRKRQGRLESGESDRVLRFARIMGKAVAVFGSEEDARRWMNSPQFGLGDAIPLDYASTEVGAREVEDLLGRIEHGVYS